jgi:hypothetical protein
MSDQRNLIVGFDLNNDYSQISCYNNKSFEPESISMTPDKTKYLIPTVMGVKNATKEWVVGEDAIRLESVGTGIKVQNLLDRLQVNEEVEIYGTLFQPVTLLEKFFRKTLQQLKVYYPGNSILQLVVTMRDLNESLVNGVYQALDNLGIGKDRVYIQSHLRSYQYYALSQSKDIWLNDVALFDLDDKGLSYYQITINRKSHPYVVGTIYKDFTETFSYDMTLDRTNKEQLEYIFENVSKNVLHKQIVSTIYVTGKGFEGDWADNVLKELCVGRRVFKGQNLYTKGACFAARELTGDKKLEEFLILSNEMISSHIILNGYYDAKLAEVYLAKAGTPWYEIDEKIDVILDNTQAIEFTLKDVMKHDTKKINVKLEGFPTRPNRMTRVEIRLKFMNQTGGIIAVKDKGFGEFYPSTNRIIEYNLEGEL